MSEKVINWGNKSNLHRGIDEVFKIMLKPSEFDMYEERAAILEFDAGFEPMKAAGIACNELLEQQVIL